MAPEKPRSALHSLHISVNRLYICSRLAS